MIALSVKEKVVLSLGCVFIVAGIALIVLMFLFADTEDTKLTTTERTYEEISAFALNVFDFSTDPIGSISSKAGGTMTITGSGDIQAGPFGTNVLKPTGAAWTAATSPLNATMLPFGTGTPFTVVGVCYPESPGTNSDMNLYHHEDAGSGTDMDLTVSMIANGDVTAVAADGTTTSTATYTGAGKQDRMHVYILTWDGGASKMKLYIDGHNTNVTNPTDSDNNIDNTQDRSGTSVFSCFTPNALYGELQIYNSVLSSQDIVDLSSQLLTKFAPALAYNTRSMSFTVDSAVSVSPASTYPSIGTLSIAPALPAGLSFNTGTGAITGTPTAYTDNATYTISGTGIGFDETIDIWTHGAPSVTYPSITYGEEIKELTISPMFNLWTPGSGDTFAVSPTLPAGLSLDTSTGVISGTPTASAEVATYTITSTVTSNPITVPTSTFKLYVLGAAQSGDAPTLTYKLDSVYTQRDIIGITPETTGSFFTINPSLPEGLTIDPLTGVISGIGTATRSIVYNVVAQSITGKANAQTIRFRIDGRLTYGEALTARTNVAFKATPTVDEGFSEFIVRPLLPDGLSINKATGTISGTPTGHMDAASYLVRGVNEDGAYATTSFSLSITDSKEFDRAYLGGGIGLITVGSIMLAHTYLTLGV